MIISLPMIFIEPIYFSLFKFVGGKEGSAVMPPFGQRTRGNLL